MQTLIRELSALMNTRQSRLQNRNITRDKESHYIMIKGTIQQQQDIRILNVYTPKIGASKRHEAKTARTQKRNRQFHDYSQTHQRPS